MPLIDAAVLANLELSCCAVDGRTTIVFGEICEEELTIEERTVKKNERQSRIR